MPVARGKIGRVSLRLSFANRKKKFQNPDGDETASWVLCDIYATYKFFFPGCFFHLFSRSTTVALDKLLKLVCARFFFFEGGTAMNIHESHLIAQTNKK